MMIYGAFISLFTAIIAAFYGYTQPKSTTTVIMKIIFYFLLVLFFVLLFIALFKDAPPIPGDKGMLPL